jgi:hypothetical protein
MNAKVWPVIISKGKIFVIWLFQVLSTFDPRRQLCESENGQVKAVRHNSVWWSKHKSIIPPERSKSAKVLD